MENRRQFAIKELAMTGGSELQEHLDALSPMVRSYISLGHRAQDPELPAVYRGQLKDDQLKMYQTKFTPLDKAQLYQYNDWMSEQIRNASNERRGRGTGTPNIRT